MRLTIMINMNYNLIIIKRYSKISNLSENNNTTVTIPKKTERNKKSKDINTKSIPKNKKGTTETQHKKNEE